MNEQDENHIRSASGTPEDAYHRRIEERTLLLTWEKRECYAYHCPTRCRLGLVRSPQINSAACSAGALNRAVPAEVRGTAATAFIARI